MLTKRNNSFVYKKMKRSLRIVLIGCLLFVFGCRTTENVIISSVETPPVDLEITEISIPKETAESDPVDSESKESDAPDQTPDRSDPSEWYYVPKTETGTVFSATVIHDTPHDSYIESRYYNTDLDFGSLRLEIVSMDLNSAEEALHISVTIPSGWSDEETDWLKREGLCLNFYLNGNHVDAFRERSLLPVTTTQYEIIYKTCILDHYQAGDTFEIVPYVKEIRFIETNEPDTFADESGETHQERKKYDLSNGDAYTEIHQRVYNSAEEKRMVNKLEVRHELSFAKVTATLPASKSSDKPYYVSMPVFAEDFAYSEQIGIYSDHRQQNIWTRGILYNREKDFSKLAVVVDSFHIWDESVELVLSWYCPSDWTDAECRSLTSECAFDFLICLDDERPNWEDHPFDARSKLKQGFSPRPMRTGYYNWSGDKYDWNWREAHLIFRDSMLTYEEWKQVRSITIIPFMNQFDQEIPPEGVAYQDGSQYAYDWHYTFLPQLAVTIQMTPDLFECGL